MRTATEKYHAVLEGKLNQAEFVRQMRQAFPQFITQWNGYKDSVSILKQKGLIFEKKEAPKKDINKLADQFPLDSIERGIDIELEAAGIDPTGNVKKDDYMVAKRKVVTNLQKDANHYLNLMSGESAKVDKHDQMKEVGKKNHKDTFNDMKKATLKEEKVDLKYAINQIIDFLTLDGHPETGHKVSKQDAADFIKTHKADIVNGDIDIYSIEDVWHNYDEYETINRDSFDEVMGVDRKGNQKPETEPSRFKGRDKSVSRATASEAMDDATMDAIKNYKPGSLKDEPHSYKPGDMFTTDFDYEGMLKAGLKIRINTPVDTMQAIYDSFEDVNYHRENRFLGDVIDAVREGDKAEALEALRGFRKEVKETLSSIFEGAFPVRERDESYVPRNGVVNERVGSLDEFISLIEDRAANNDTMPQDEAIEVMEALIEELDIPVRLVHDVAEGQLEEEPNEGNEFEAERLKAIKAGKKEFSVDGKTFPVKGAGEDEKKRAAMMKESVKAIISKVLEEGTINEAATAELARIADDYAGFEGMKGAILDLQNIVSDIEAYYDKTREKIQKTYDKLGEIRNEEGLKVGGFLAPAIETAFMKDLRPVTKKGFTKGLDQPKVRVISQKDIDMHNSGERPLGEAEPKQTVYSPNI